MSHEADSPLGSPCFDEQVVVAVVARVGRAACGRALVEPDGAAWLMTLLDFLEVGLGAAVSCWRHSGLTDSQIARELGVAEQAVAQRWPRGSR